MSPNGYDNPDLPDGDISQDQLAPEQGQLEALAQIEEPSVEEQVLPEELMVRNPLDLIPIAIANNRLLQIMYTKRNGETKLYVIEPYEVGGSYSHPAGYLWGYDRNVDRIKSFFLSNLIDIQLLNETFIPRGI